MNTKTQKNFIITVFAILILFGTMNVAFACTPGDVDIQCGSSTKICFGGSSCDFCAIYRCGDDGEWGHDGFVAANCVNCGSDEYGEWEYYTEDGKVYKKRTVIERGCENGECYERKSTEKQATRNYRIGNPDWPKRPDRRIIGGEQ